MHNLHEAFVSSKKMDYATPKPFYDALDSVFHFDTDLAASPENALCPQYFTEDDDSLKQLWRGTCWLNPPYGRALPKFVAKAAAEASVGYNNTIVMLIPARPDRLWWDEHIWSRQRSTYRDYCVDVCFVRGRLRFGAETNQAPFPSAVVVFSRSGMKDFDKSDLLRLDIGHWIWANP
jgi:phage N-6-adenine-methyltransferase